MGVGGAPALSSHTWGEEAHDGEGLTGVLGDGKKALETEGSKPPLPHLPIGCSFHQPRPWSCSSDLPWLRGRGSFSWACGGW